MSNIKLKVKSEKACPERQLNGLKMSGFSLIEVLISGAIFAIVAIVGSASLTNILKTRAYTQKINAVNNSLRVGLETILRETRDAHYVGYNSNGHICLYDKNKKLQNEFDTDPFDPSQTTQRGLVLIPPSLSKKFITPEDTTLIGGFSVKGQYNNDYTGDCNGAPDNSFVDDITPYLYVSITIDSYPEKTKEKTASIIAVPRN